MRTASQVAVTGAMALFLSCLPFACSRACAQETDPALVELVVAAIDEYAGGDVCGSSCARLDYPDRSDETLTPERIEALASVLVWGAETFDVPLDELVATAAQETTFHASAIGSGGECGLFQQTPRYVHAEWLDGYKIPDSDRALCTGLLRDPVVAVQVFAAQYHHRRNVAYQERRDRGMWACYYHGGRECTADDYGYYLRHERFRRWAADRLRVDG